MEITAIVIANALFVLLAAGAAFLGGRVFGLMREEAAQAQSVARRVAELSALIEKSLDSLEAVGGAEGVGAAMEKVIDRVNDLGISIANAAASTEAEGRALDLSAALSALMSYGEGKV